MSHYNLNRLINKCKELRYELKLIKKELKLIKKLLSFLVSNETISIKE